MPIIPKWRVHYHELFYSSATLTGSGNSGTLATPAVVNGGNAIFPLFFTLVGENLLTDETADINIRWYEDGTLLQPGTFSGTSARTTFAQLTAAALIQAEGYPQDMTLFSGASNPAVSFKPALPFHGIFWALAGTTISLNFDIYWNYMSLDA